MLCAVSGGKDSMFLLERMAELAPSYGFELRCAHFDHCLRGTESDRDREFVKDYCQKRSIPCYIGAEDVRNYAEVKGMGIEEAARVMRYGFLEKTADKIGACRIATAHTANDNAETMLFNLTRGSGLKGLCGIPPVRGRIIRPMLQTTTEEVLRYLKEKSIPYVEDSTNLEDDYTRNKIRHRVIPVLRELSFAFDENLVRCAAILREDEEYLTEMAKSFVISHFSNDEVSASEFAALPKPISARVLLLVVPYGLSSSHIEAVRGIAEGEECHAYADIPGLRVIRDYDKLLFGERKITEISKRYVQIGETNEIPEAGLELFCEFINCCEEIHNSFNIFFFKSDSICGNMFVMSRLDGEKIRLNGRNCTKTLKKLFSEAKLNGENKSLIPVLYDEKGVIAVYGFGIAERCAPKQGDGVIKVEIRSKSANGTI